ncbi:LacI family DNA-binding transcriptional regulator [Vallitalea okinawensis]|uniref:LacI family DNA-binding transcriptional regulator n=1 Tax=Vallitalea okinawensis TaxID=2078660 RepID=UPI000CFD3577|nr:LacI family DNA-binding transcriptional regulator [Vallitalea okinawensis]
MAITIKDIAKIAGVNYSTVSRSLNDSPLVAQPTKDRIKKIAEELGFEFNANARSLTTSKTGTIGIIYPENFDEFGIHLYYSSLHHQLRKSLEKLDLDLIVAFPKNRITKENNVKKLITKQKVDGLIIAQSDLDQETLRFIAKAKVPFVFFHHPVDTKFEDVDAVYTDHFQGGYLATKHLIEQGHQRIICMTAGDELEFQLRTGGYRAALDDHGLVFKDDLIIEGRPYFELAKELIIEKFEVVRSADAIFAQNDLLAWGVIEALKEKNIKVPQDIAVVGYDDIELSTYITPRITTIRQPREEIAALTCERLYELLSSKNTDRKRKKKTELPPSLIIRESCGSRI